MNGRIQAVAKMLHLWALVNSKTGLEISLKDQNIHEGMTVYKFFKTTFFHEVGYEKAM